MSIEIKDKKPNVKISKHDLMNTQILAFYKKYTYDPPISRRKAKIPKTLRKDVWEKTNNNNIGVCYCCRQVLLITKFHAGHVLAESKGGTLHIDNLFAVCSACNHEMGTMNMFDYIKERCKMKEQLYLKQCGLLIHKGIYPDNNYTQIQNDHIISDFKMAEEQVRLLPKYDTNTEMPHNVPDTIIFAGMSVEEMDNMTNVVYVMDDMIEQIEEAEYKQVMDDVKRRLELLKTR